MKKLSIVIMAHPERQEWAKKLSQELQAPIVYDKKNNIWDTCRRAWLSIDKSCEYGLVIQDDSILCPDFKNRAEKYLTEDYVYSFYAGNLLATQLKSALKFGKDRFVNKFIYNEVALCMKTSHIDSMVKFCDDRQTNLDHEISNWARKNKIGICYTIPSLVDHRDSESIYKKVYNRPILNKPRKAVFFDIIK